MSWIKLLTHLEIIEAGGDSVRVRSTGLHVLSQKFSNRDALPLEVLRECLEVLLSAAAGSARQEYSLAYQDKNRWC